MGQVLSADNQHELCVLARKFGNLHVYGCWWFCNNPSIIERTTRMRLEMLGTAFTCQVSKETPTSSGRIGTDLNLTIPSPDGPGLT